MKASEKENTEFNLSVQWSNSSIEIDDPSGVFGNRDYGKTTVTKVKL